MKRFITLTLLSIFLTLNIQAQRDCGVMALLDQHLLEDPKLQIKMDQIEQKTQEYVQKQGNHRSNGIITIPVVVHVVYNNENENISQDQINSQIDILNEDFRRLNADASNTPSLFQSVAADARIEFCLASIDPSGNETNGITRTSTTRTSFGTNDQVKFGFSGGKNAWPAEDYLNVWVCDIKGSVLGYAQFPGGAPSTDGVVNDYQYFGNIGTATSPFNLGRTLTHEVGHFLNLKHVWGAEGCSVDDLVADTPAASAPNYTDTPCTFNGNINSCDTGADDLPDMFQNYMDYSDDGCMNLFTVGQKLRMRAILGSGGARASLATSTKCGIPGAPTCSDGIQNGDESGIDCGGANCPSCPEIPSCTDGFQNGTETGVDCGGTECAPCPCEGTAVTISIQLDNYPEETSWMLTDTSGVTIAEGGTYGRQKDGSTVSVDLCLASGCYDFRITDTYGDGICCAYGSGTYTVTAGDSIVASGGNFGYSEATNFCVSGIPDHTCSDGVQNGQETGIDCGGPYCPSCLVIPSCTDGIQNGQETGIDCGGLDCPSCPTESTCNDGVQNGQETGVDCGGPDCPSCPVAATCNDGIQNGQETGIDCGGPDCPSCPTLSTCDDGIQNGQETGVDCGGPDCNSCNNSGCTTTNIDFNDFESGYGIWNDGGSDCARNAVGNYAFSGTRTIRLRDNSTTSTTTTDDLALASFEEVTIDFTYIARSMEAGEDFLLQVSSNGGSSYNNLLSWAAGSDFSNDYRKFESVSITGTFSNSTRFRFRCNASSNADYIYLDDIKISGCSNGSREHERELQLTSIVHTDISNVEVFPNPTYDRLNIEFAASIDGPVQINVINMAGQTLMTAVEDALKGKNTSIFQVGNLEIGIYYVYISNGENRILKKFAVIR